MSYVSLVCLLIGSLSISLWCRRVDPGRWFRLRAMLRAAWPIGFTFWASVQLAELFAAQTGRTISSAARTIELSAAALPCLPIVLAPRRFRAWAATLVVLTLALLVFADSIFHRQFGVTISAELLTRVGDAWTVRTTWLPMLVWSDSASALVMTAAIVMGALHGRELQEIGGWKLRVAELLVVGVAALPAILAARAEALAMDPVAPTNALRAGVLQAHWIDLARKYETRAGSLSQEELESIRNELDRRRAPFPSRPLRHHNIILLQVESLNAWVLDLSLGDRKVMPNLARFRDLGASFELLDQTASGRSSDSDFLALCSQHPLPSAVVAVAHTENDVIALPGLLREHGWSTHSVSCDPPELWVTARRHSRYGIERSAFRDDLAVGKTSDCDRIVLRRLASEVRGWSRPFFGWAVTLSMHSPHTPPQDAERIAMDHLAGSMLGDYLDTAHDTDKQLGELFDALASLGLLRDTLVVIYGDHAEHTMMEPELLEAVIPDRVRADSTWKSRVPLIVIGPGVETKRLSTAGGLIDVAPTVLRLLGMGIPRVMMGRSLLERPDGWVTRWDDTTASRELLWQGGHCRETRGRVLSPEPCQEMVSAARQERALSNRMTRTNSFVELAR